MTARRNSKKALRRVAVVLFAAVLACGGCTGEGAKTKGTAPPEKVAICVIGTAGIPVALALENGLFAAQGLEVTLRKSSSGLETLESMLKGECDLATPTETPVVFKSQENREFSVLATTGASENALRILASRKSGIAGARDLKGKRILVSKGSTSHFFLDMFLASNGLSEADVTVVMGGVADVSAAFSSGEIDAYCQTDVMILEPLQALGGDAVVLAAPGLCHTTFNVVATNRYIREKPGAVKSILAALLQNEALLTGDPAKAVRAVSRILAVDAGSAAAIIANYDWRIGLHQTLVLSFEHVTQWAMESGFIQKAALPNYLDIVDTAPLRSLKPEAVLLIK